jgi:ribose transport system permease protein
VSEGKSTRAGRFVAEYGVLVVLAVLIVVMAIATPHFLTPANLINVLRQVSINAIIACGMTLVIITAGIDLSVGSLVAMASCLAMLAIGATDSDMLGILVGIAAGAAGGAFNGSLIAWARVPPFIMTLATLTIFSGIALISTGGAPIIRFTGDFRWLGQGVVFGIPVPVIVMVIVAMLTHVVLSRTAFGAAVYAVGGNEEAARLSGIAVKRVKFYVYVICGALTGLAAMILMGRLSSAQPNMGQGFELDAIAAVVLGGTSLMGGRGTVWGTLIGALVIGILNNGFNLLSIDPYFQLVAKGAIILLAVLIDSRVRQHLTGAQAG